MDILIPKTLILTSLPCYDAFVPVANASFFRYASSIASPQASRPAISIVGESRTSPSLTRRNQVHPFVERPLAHLVSLTFRSFCELGVVFTFIVLVGVGRARWGPCLRKYENNGFSDSIRSSVSSNTVLTSPFRSFRILCSSRCIT